MNKNSFLPNEYKFICDGMNILKQKIKKQKANDNSDSVLVSTEKKFMSYYNAVISNQPDKLDASALDFLVFCVHS